MGAIFDLNGPAAQDSRLADRATTYHHGGSQDGEIRTEAETRASKGKAEDSGGQGAGQRPAQRSNEHLPVSLSRGDEVPHIFIRESHQRARKILISGGKRFLQQNLPVADVTLEQAEPLRRS
jgi:hypothetical protein